MQITTILNYNAQQGRILVIRPCAQFVINGCQNVLHKNPKTSFKKNSLLLLQNRIKHNVVVFSKRIINLKTTFPFYLSKIIHYADIDVVVAD